MQQPKVRHFPTVNPELLISATLNSSCTSITVASSPYFMDQINKDLCYMIYGKQNGETVIASEDQCIQQTIPSGSELPCPISVVLAGDGRNVDDSEIFIIAADGLLRAFSFPICNERGVEGSFEEAEFEFEQLLNSNISFAEILDIDNDGRNELLVAMTDRVVRSYRFEFEDEDEDMHFVPLTKFEVPSHIYGISVGWDIGLTVFLSQANHQQYVRISMIPGNENVRMVQPMSVEDKGRNTYQLVVPPKPIRVSLMSSLVKKVFVANNACNSEVLLRTDKATIVGAACATLGSGLRMLVTIDNRGSLAAYGWKDHLIPSTEPLFRSTLPRAPDRIDAFACPVHPHTLYLGIAYLNQRLSLVKLNFKNVSEAVKLAES